MTAPDHHMPGDVQRNSCTNGGLHSALCYLSPNRFEEIHSRKPVKSVA